MTSNKETPLLRVTELSHYYGDQVGCEEINLEVYNGEVLGIVGESGSGKTTLLKIISGLLFGITILESVNNGGWYVPNGLLLLPPSAFFIIGLLIWVARTWKPAQVEEREFKIQVLEEH